MDSTVCTLFEKNFHYGLAALVNSLYNNGYRGAVYVGFRGELPPWAKPVSERGDVSVFRVAEGLEICFLRLETAVHLANYKPDFMLDVWDSHCPNSEQLFYFDPDIVIKCRWEFFEEWAKKGIALCEDVNSPVPETHPLRKGWQELFTRHGIELSFKTDLYLNGGFVGVDRRNHNFLNAWCKVQAVMEEEIGGLEQALFDKPDRTTSFAKTDQDALNIATGLTQAPLSLVGKDGMDFISGGYIMSHAIGSPKPWNNKYIRRALGGSAPSLAEKEYWKNVEAPLRIYSPLTLSGHRLRVRLAAAIGRFIRRR